MINKNELPAAALTEHKLNQFNELIYGSNDDDSDELSTTKGKLVELNFDDDKQG